LIKVTSLIKHHKLNDSAGAQQDVSTNKIIIIIITIIARLTLSKYEQKQSAVYQNLSTN